MSAVVDIAYLCPRCRSGERAKAGIQRQVQRWRCGSCGYHYANTVTRRRPGTSIGTTSIDSRGRHWIYLGHGHRYANTGGWQYVYRYVVMVALGRVLRSDEHVHHIDGNLDNNELDNLEVVAAAYHGSIHASGISVARAVDGRFVELPQMPEFDLPRWRAIIGRAANVARSMGNY